MNSKIASYRNILLKAGDGIATITINMPQTMNALCAAFYAEMHAALDLLGQDDSLRVLLITGGDIFASGTDIREMMNAAPFEAFTLCEASRALNNRLEKLPIPVIAVINGMALGGGLELALACDFRVASAECVLGMPEAGLGIIPGGGGTQRLLRLVGMARTQEIVMLGNKVSGVQARELGLVTAVTDAAGTMEEALKLAERLKKMPAAALKFAKAAIVFGASRSPDACMEYEKALFSLCFSGPDQREGMQAFTEKRPPNYVHKK